MNLNRRHLMLLPAALCGAPLPLAAWLWAPAAQAATAPSPDTNLLVAERGVKVAGASSSHDGLDAEAMVPSLARLAEPGVTPEDFYWCTADGAPFPHWVRFDLRQSQWLTTLVFNTAVKDELAYPGISARMVEVWVGTAGPDALQRVATFELERARARQAVRLAPVQARWLKLVITANWGHPVWTEMNATAAFDDGSRPASLADALDAQGRVDVYGLYFDFGRATLRPESAPVLEQIVAWHRAHAQERLRIEGHTDAVGNDAANAALSLARARAVVDALVSRGVPRPRLEPVGHGARQPVADNRSDVGRARNRRVTVVRADRA